MSDQPRGVMHPIYPIFDPKQGLPDNRPGHITGRTDPPPDTPKGISIWPF